MVLLALAAGAWLLCAGSGLIAGFLYKDEIAAMQSQSRAAEDDIRARTKLGAHVSTTFRSSFTSGLDQVEVTVTYDFVPPTADQEKLVKEAEEAVRQNVKNVTDVSVTGPGMRRSARPGRE